MPIKIDFLNLWELPHYADPFVEGDCKYHILVLNDI